MRVGDHVRGIGDGGAAVADLDPLQSLGVSVASVDPDAGDDLLRSIGQMDVRSLERFQDLGGIARPLPRVRTAGRFEVGRLDVDQGVGVGQAAVRRRIPPAWSKWRWVMMMSVMRSGSRPASWGARCSTA